jgi:hypothetical protein
MNTEMKASPHSIIPALNGGGQCEVAEAEGHFAFQFKIFTY